MGTYIYLGPGPYRATLTVYAPPTYPATPEPEFACTATVRFALKASPKVPLWELAVAHDPAVDPGGRPSRSRDFSVQAGADYYLSFAWGCPWTLDIDRGS